MGKTNARSWHEQNEFWDAFAATIFDAQRRSVASEEVEDIVRLTGLQPTQAVCDLCCGIGRHSLELARRGYAVTAVDRTERYLEEARNRATDEGLSVEFVQADMRRFRRPESFDLVVNLFTSFGYFEEAQDDRLVLENVYRSLRPGGRLVLEMIGKEILARIFAARDWQQVDGTILLSERKVVDAWKRIENRWILIRDGRQQEWTFSHRLYSAAELSALLAGCGFREVQVYGGLTGSAYDEKAERMVLVGRKTVSGGLDAMGAGGV